MDMSAERKRHGAQHVRSARKVAVDYEPPPSVSDDDIGRSVTVNVPHRGLGIADAVRSKSSLNVILHFRNYTNIFLFRHTLQFIIVNRLLDCYIIVLYIPIISDIFILMFMLIEKIYFVIVIFIYSYIVYTITYDSYYFIVVYAAI